MFPDEAVLPAGSHSGGDGAGPSSAGQAGEAPLMNGGAAGAGESGGAAGDSPTASGGVGGTATGGDGGAGGAGGPSCDQPERRVVGAASDTWIEAKKETATHGPDKQLFVAGGADEQRALLQVDLPAASDGAWLIKATLTLNLEANEDAMRAARRLSVHRVTKPFVENRTTWLNFGTAGQTWSAPGGDFELQPLGSALLPEQTAEGPVSFDVTEALASMVSSQSVPLSLIILETGTLPNPPSALAFTSTEGDALAPSLVIEFCAP